ncbi:hypothetical protein D3C87_1648200 [compost metagenome]
MKFEAALVRLGNHKIERVPHRIGFPALHTRKPLRPWLGAFGIECISRRPHLHEHRIHPHAFVKIEQTGELLLLLFRKEVFAAWPINIVDSGNPDRSKFSLRGQITLRFRALSHATFQ